MILSIRPLYESVKVEVKTMWRCGEERWLEYKIFKRKFSTM